MGLIGTLNIAVGGNVISPSEYNQNFAAVRDAFNDSAVLTDFARTISVQHTFAPSTSIPPFILGANAQGELVTGLNADQLDSQHGSFYRNAGNLNAGTVPSARVSGSYTGITAVGTLTGGSIPASLLTGTIASARISGSYTGITAVGTINTGVWQGTPVSSANVGNLPTSKITTGVFANARIAQSNVTQHEGALSIAGSQLTGSVAASLLSGTIASARISGSYTGITAVGTLSSLNISGTLTVSSTFTVGALNLGGTTLQNIIVHEETAIDFGTFSETVSTRNVSVPGTQVGDTILVSVLARLGSPANVASLFAEGAVTTPGTVIVRLYNESAGADDNTDIDVSIVVIQI